VKSIEYWNQWFPTLVENSGSSMEFIKSANLIIEFDINQERINPKFKIIENPFFCEIEIIDDRNKIYKSRHENWWFPESTSR